MRPSVTLPKLALLGLAVSEPCAIPVPESGIAIAELVALDTRLNIPPAGPVVVGAKVVLKVTL